MIARFRRWRDRRELLAAARTEECLAAQSLLGAREWHDLAIRLSRRMPISRAERRAQAHAMLADARAHRAHARARREEAERL